MVLGKALRWKAHSRSPTCSTPCSLKWAASPSVKCPLLSIAVQLEICSFHPQVKARLSSVSSTSSSWFLATIWVSFAPGRELVTQAQLPQAELHQGSLSGARERRVPACPILFKTSICSGPQGSECAVKNDMSVVIIFGAKACLFSLQHRASSISRKTGPTRSRRDPQQSTS